MLSTRLIDLFIIGAQKGGTTSLKNYLMEHPQIISHPHTEMTYFSGEKEFQMGYDSAFKKYFSVKDLSAQSKILAKNVTLSFRETPLRRLAEHNPKCKILFVLRDPVERAFSAHSMATRSGWMKHPFNYAKKAIEIQNTGQKDVFYRFMLDLGIYSRQIETLLKNFPKEQVKIVLYDDLKKDPISVCKNMFRFIGVDEDIEPDTNKKYNIGTQPKSNTYASILKYARTKAGLLKKTLKAIIGEHRFILFVDWLNELNRGEQLEKKTMDLETRLLLQEFFRPYNEVTSKLIGRDLNQLWGYKAN